MCISYTSVPKDEYDNVCRLLYPIWVAPSIGIVVNNCQEECFIAYTPSYHICSSNSQALRHPCRCLRQQCHLRAEEKCALFLIKYSQEAWRCAGKNLCFCFGFVFYIIMPCPSTPAPVHSACQSCGTFILYAESQKHPSRCWANRPCGIQKNKHEQEWGRGLWIINFVCCTSHYCNYTPIVLWQEGT